MYHFVLLVKPYVTSSSKPARTSMSNDQQPLMIEPPDFVKEIFKIPVPRTYIREPGKA